MAITSFVIIMLFMIVLSNILDSAFPSFPLPLIQIVLGVIVTLTPLDIRLELEPEIFMGVLIAPLLYREAEDADLASLWRVRREVIFMVFGLVFVTVFVIGFSVNYFVASIPLAACFCLGGILGPTDPIAVKSVSARIEIDNHIMSILRGEFLINDSSGVIAFNFAALALVTGSFSFGQAAVTFVVVCLGGFLVGILVGIIKNGIVRALRRARIHHAAAFVIIELLVPFICFFIAEGMGFNGIIAAVTAGVRQGLLIRRVDIFEARFTVVKNSFWDMISLVFNSFIFILIGLELPIIIPEIIENPDYTLSFAMLIGLLATVVMFVIRYVGVWLAGRGLPGKNIKERVQSRFVLTLSGVKGTVSLATAFALPTVIAGGIVFTERPLLLFITACVIVYSLIVAIVLLPIIAKPKEHAVQREGLAIVLKDTIERIEASDEFFEPVVMRMKRRLRELELEGKLNEKDSYDFGGTPWGFGKKFIDAERRTLEAERQGFEQQLMVGTYTEKQFNEYSRQLKEGYEIEREVLAECVRDGRISDEEADEIRVEINTLENFTIEELQNDFSTRVIIENSVRRRRMEKKKK